VPTPDNSAHVARYDSAKWIRCSSYSSRALRSTISSVTTIAGMGGAINADPDQLTALGARYGLDFKLESVPELLERFGLRIGEPLSGDWTP
jgi:hypothetical protein